jgi:hypothetical protein
MSYLRILLFSIVLLPNIFYSQCCGGGAHVGGNIFLGTLGKGYLQTNVNYRQSHSEGYMQNDWNSDFKFVKNAFSRHTGMQIGYGISKRVTADFETGYFINRTQNFEFGNYSFSQTGSGLTSLTLATRINIFKLKKSEIEWTAGFGVRMPWSKKRLMENGVELSEDVQPNNGSYGLVFRSFLAKEFDHIHGNLFLINSVSLNKTNEKDYKEGNTYISTLLYGQQIIHNLTAIIQVRNEIRGKAIRYGNDVISSGGYRFVFVPQLNYTIDNKYNIGLIYEQPIYRFYHGIQLKDLYAFSINLNFLLPTTKKAKEECEKE